MATYTGQKIKDTYESILKLDDNGNLTSSTKIITDGLGNQTPLSISSTEVKSSVNLEATGFKTPTGTSSEFLKSDGSVDSNTYSIASDLDNYLLNTTDTLDGVFTLENDMGVSGNFDAAQLRLDTSNVVNTTGFQGMRFQTSSAPNYGWSMGVNRSGLGRGSFRFFEHNNSNAGTERFTMLQDGNIGIGENNPSYKLDVSGDGRFTSDVTSTNFVISSDIRLKNNIEEVDNKHINVDWKTFEMNSDQGQKRYGVIAQELEEFHPEFVRTNDEGIKSVAYVDLLIAKNAELEARIEQLEKLLIN
jgi:hypothetical protein